MAISSITSRPIYTPSIPNGRFKRCFRSIQENVFVEPDYSLLGKIVYDHNNSPPRELFIGDFRHLTFYQILERSKSPDFKRQVLDALSSPSGFGHAKLPLMSEEQYIEFSFNLFGPLIDNQLYGQGSTRNAKRLESHTDYNGNLAEIYRGGFVPKDNPAPSSVNISPMYNKGNFPRNDLPHCVSSLYYEEIQCSGGALLLHRTPQVLKQMQKKYELLAREENRANPFHYFRNPDCVRSRQFEGTDEITIGPLLAPFGWGGGSTLQFREGRDIHPNALDAYQYLIESIGKRENHSIVVPTNGTWVFTRNGVIHGREPFDGIRRVLTALHNSPPQEYRIPTFTG